jgi:hypothetical protein
MRALWLKLFKHFSSADRIEHAGYLCCVAIAEHTAVRLLAIALLVGIVIYAVRHDR